MADFGLDTQLGFVKKRFNDIQNELKVALGQIEDPVTGEFLQVDFNEDDPLINVANSFIDVMADTWEVLELVYQQFDPLSSTGPSLSGLVQLNGITRKGGTPSTVNIRLSGDEGTIVTKGSQFNSAALPEVIWKTDEEYVIPAAGFIDGTASSVENGLYFAVLGTLDQIVTNIPGWQAVTNTSDSVVGTLDEDSDVLKVRRRSSTLSPAVAIVEAIYSNVLNIDGVTYSRIYVNKTLAVDSRGIPEKTVAAVVVGGGDEEIAAELFKRIGIAVDTYGTTSIPITDPFGETHQINFIRPDNIDVNVVVDVTVTDQNLWSDTSEQEIKNSIIAYAASGVIGLDGDPEKVGFDPFGFPPGEEVAISRLYTPINSVAGHKVTQLRIGYVGQALGTSDLAIDWDEVSRFLDANITVNVTVP